MKKKRTYNGRWAKKKIKCLELNGGPFCALCREEKDPDLLVFHHLISSDKGMKINKMIRKYGMDKIKEELKKCVVLCFECHRKVHRVGEDMKRPLNIEEMRKIVAKADEKIVDDYIKRKSLEDEEEEIEPGVEEEPEVEVIKLPFAIKMRDKILFPPEEAEDDGEEEEYKKRDSLIGESVPPLNIGQNEVIMEFCDLKIKLSSYDSVNDLIEKSLSAMDKIMKKFKEKKRKEIV